MKNSMKIISLFCLILSLSGSGLLAQAAKEKESIQLAILLDTSSSMDGLIEQAKSQIWKIVNELATTKKNGMAPAIEVALYEYGNNGIPSGEGYIRMKVPMTRDLDKVSDELFKLTTDGGDEYCGKVILSAVKGLNWSKNKNDLKVIIIAGNEPFSQGDVAYEKACKEAISRGIIVNTIFCGDYKEGVETFWKKGADLADGKYMNIDQNQKIAAIEAPQDNDIIKLSEDLNKTYVAYGKAGVEKKERQALQDANASSLNKEVAAQRALTKASEQYENSSWDLVDAKKNKALDMEKLKTEELPAEMQKMNKKEREEYINKMLTKRNDIQKKIQKLNDERQKYIEKERKKQSADNTLDTAVLKTIKAQAAKKGFK
ncbi:MAG: VWA domain-containing protein [bacterium]|nr:VWA domain-containing protein [bacterium]